MNNFPCPCCGYKTYDHEPNSSYEICDVCFWEDDPFQLEDPDYEESANPMSLRQAQKNFSEFGACDKDMLRYVRSPLKDETQPTLRFAAIEMSCVILEGTTLTKTL